MMDQLTGLEKILIGLIITAKMGFDGWVAVQVVRLKKKVENGLKSKVDDLHDEMDQQ